MLVTTTFFCALGAVSLAGMVWGAILEGRHRADVADAARRNAARKAREAREAIHAAVERIKRETRKPRAPRKAPAPQYGGVYFYSHGMRIR